MPVLVHDGLNLSASCVNKTLCEFIAVQFIITGRGRGRALVEHAHALHVTFGNEQKPQTARPWECGHGRIPVGSKRAGGMPGPGTRTIYLRAGSIGVQFIITGHG